MRLFGLQITRQKELSRVSNNGGLWGVIQESFAGAWQRNIVLEKAEGQLAFSAVYACVSLISDDISKMRIKLTELQSSGIWTEVTDSPLLPVIRKPNNWQTRIQFMSQWVVSKLLHGNTYVLKERDNRRVVVGLYVLDPRLVTPLVADNGDVFYQVNQDKLSGVTAPITVPSSEIIHDRGICPFHPLVGVSPIYACGLSTTQGLKIQRNSATFFENMSRPSGQLTAPGFINDETAARVRHAFEEKFAGGGLGRLFVGGDGLKYEPMTMPASDAQLIEQLRFTVEDVGRCFKVPLYKLGGPPPTFSNATAMNQEYYTQCLQAPIEAIELLYDEGLGLPVGRGTEMDTDVLLRMDPLSRMEVDSKGVGSGVLSPNNARLRQNLGPVEGGDSPYLQQQNYSLLALSKRDAKDDPFAPNTPAQPAPTEPPVPADQSAKELTLALMKRIQAATRHKELFTNG